MYFVAMSPRVGSATFRITVMSTASPASPRRRWRPVRALPAGRLFPSAKTRQDMTFVLAGIPVHVGGVLAVLGPFVLGLTIAPLATNLSAALVSTLLFGALCAVLLVVLVPVVTRLQRSRMSELAAVRITAAQVRAGTGWRAYARALRSEALWRQAFYHAVVGPVISFGALAAFAVWPAGIVLAAVPLYA